MSKYTTEVRYICETAANLPESKGYSSIDEILTAAAPKIFDFNFPIYDENYRSILEKKILKHYYTREISAETVGLWKLWLDARMNEIMPYYNQLYKSALLDFNPLYDVDYTRTYTRKNDGLQESSSSGSSSGTGKTTGKNTGKVTGSKETTTTDNETGTFSGSKTDKYADTPQGSLQNVISGKYLTNARIDSEDNETTRNNTGSVSDTTAETQESTQEGTNESTASSEMSSTGKASNMEEYTETVSGKQGGVNYAAMVTEFRKTFLNIDMMIINDLSDLFFNLY